jgi:hypothetical protein
MSDPPKRRPGRPRKYNTAEERLQGANAARRRRYQQIQADRHASLQDGPRFVFHTHPSIPAASSAPDTVILPRVTRSRSRTQGPQSPPLDDNLHAQAPAHSPIPQPLPSLPLAESAAELTAADAPTVEPTDDNAEILQVAYPSILLCCLSNAFLVRHFTISASSLMPMRVAQSHAHYLNSTRRTRDPHH